jgi:acetyl-CoA acetyltransferase
LKLDDVDGFATAAGDWAEGGASSDIIDLCEHLGIRPRYFDSTDIGGGSYVSHAGHAANAIRSGAADVVVISYAACMKWWPLDPFFWDGLTYPAGLGQFEIPYSPTIIASMALMIQRHMHDYGTSPEHLARIAVACRRNAAANPHARYRDPLMVEDVLASPMIASPFRKLDCCVVTDGGGAIVLTGAGRARDCKSQPAWIQGFGESLGSLSLSRIPKRMVTPAKVSGEAAFAMAGLQPSDIDCAQIYDAFTATVLLALDDLGFCPKGQTGEWIAGGAIEQEGILPINTDGGGLSSNHPGRRGIFLLIEAVRQLRGESPGFNLPECRNVLAHGWGGIMSAAATMVIGR